MNPRAQGCTGRGRRLAGRPPCRTASADCSKILSPGSDRTKRHAGEEAAVVTVSVQQTTGTSKDIMFEKAKWESACLENAGQLPTQPLCSNGSQSCRQDMQFARHPGIPGIQHAASGYLQEGSDEERQMLEAGTAGQLAVHWRGSALPIRWPTRARARIPDARAEGATGWPRL